MFKKLNIKYFKIPPNCNTGFVIDYTNSTIINTDNNYTLPLPFKTTLVNTLYLFEILCGPDYILLTLILNTFLCNPINYTTNLMAHKELFKILSKNPHPFQSFKKVYSILNILRPKSYEFNSPNLINISKYKFIDLSRENIAYSDSIINLYHPKIFMIIGKSFNLNSGDEYCIVDELTNLIPELSIHRRNSNNISIADLYNNKTLYISKTFFFSKKYMNEYKKYHSDYKSEFAYHNYQNYFNTLNHDDYCFNVELTNHKIFILKDINIKKLLSHPLIYSNNTIIIINSCIKQKDINNFKLIFKKKHNNKEGLSYNDALYLDPCKHHLYKLYLNSIRVKGDIFLYDLGLAKLSELQNTFKLVYKDNIPEAYKNNPKIELYKYSDELIIETITNSIIIISSEITLYDVLNIFEGEEVFNVKKIYQLYNLKLNR